MLKYNGGWWKKRGYTAKIVLDREHLTAKQHRLLTAENEALHLQQKRID